MRSRRASVSALPHLPAAGTAYCATAAPAERIEGIMPPARPASAAAPRPAMLIPEPRPPDIAVAAPRLPPTGLATAAAVSPALAPSVTAAPAPAPSAGQAARAARPALP